MRAFLDGLADTSLGSWAKAAIRSGIPHDRPFPILSGPARGIRWYPESARLACWLGRYEREAVAFCAAHVHPGDVVWDVGGFVGFYALLFARLVGATGHVHSCEPDPDNRRALVRHLDANPAMAQRVVVHPCAIAAIAGVTRFQGQAGAGSRIVEEGPLTVRAISLRQIDSALPQFVKMDVEGMEAEILPAADDMLSAHQTTWLVETHGSSIKAACLALFSKHGYDTRRLDEHQIVALPRTRSR